MSCLSFLHCKCQSCAHRHTITPWWVYSPVCVWISALLSTCPIFALFIGRTLLPSCASGLRSPFCPLVLLLLRGENTFSSRFDTIDLNPVQGCLIFTLSLRLCLPIAFSPCTHIIIQLLLSTNQSTQIKLNQFQSLVPVSYTQSEFGMEEQETSTRQI